MSFRWVASQDERRRRADGPEIVLRFAASQETETVSMTIELAAEATVASPPRLVARTALGGGPIPIEPGAGRGSPDPAHGQGRDRFVITYTMKVPPAAEPDRDDQVVIDVEEAEGSGQGVPPCRIVLRRTTCRIEPALLGLDLLTPETTAALLWQGWGQFRELVGLKRFLTGRGGSDVLVVRPKLRAPLGDAPTLESSGPPEVLDDAWGSCLLIKTGPAGKVRKEWDRCTRYLAHRSHPFLARCEAFLPIRPVDSRNEPDQPENTARGRKSKGSPGVAPKVEAVLPGPPERVTLIGSFLGGDLLHPEPLEEVIRGPADAGRCQRLIDKVFHALAPWQNPCATHPLKEWRRVFRGQRGNPNDWLLFGKFDLTRKAGKEERQGREEFAAGLRWDTSFIEEEHLHHHLLGKKRDGLLYAIREIPARFSLTQGDLNPRNVLCDGETVWLIDFEHTGVAPTLMDYARLEANLRLGCLPLRPAGENLEDMARAFECRLLDQFLGGEGGIEPTRELAAGLGVEPEALHKLAHAIAYIRRLASAHCLPIYADHRDYLAVLYLTVLNLLQYAGRGLAPPENDRVLVSLAWALEDVLDRVLSRTPCDRKRRSLRPCDLVRADWILPPGAPQRVVYFLDREDGRRALPALAATRGVLQFPPHHLDVLDHTLLVLANVEALIEAPDPLTGFLDPAALDLRVEDDLSRQGIRLLPIPAPEARPPEPETSDLTGTLDVIRERLRSLLADESARLLLKWTALLHDVGKPATRSVNTEKQPPKPQFIGHEIYGLQLLEDLLQHLFSDRRPTPGTDRTGRTPQNGQAESPRLLDRVRRLIRCHHLHHQIGQRYRENAEAFDALVDGLRTREVPDAEYDYLAKSLEPDLAEGRNAGDSQPDFPLLILFGFADRLACRGPDNAATVSATARIDLAVLAFWALFDEIKAHCLRRNEDQARSVEAASQLFRRLNERLPSENGIDPAVWRRQGGRLMGRLRTWYNDECEKRKARGETKPMLAELLAEGQRLLAEFGIIPRLWVPPLPNGSRLIWGCVEHLVF